MNKFKDMGLKILYPNIFLFLVFFVLGFGSVIAVFVYGLQNSFIGYISYVLSAYSLTITVARSINLIKWINKKLHSNKYTNRLITDKELKNNINLFSGTFFNMIYGIFKFIIGFIYNSIWFGATGVYYLILGMRMWCFIEFGIILIIILKKSKKSEKKFNKSENLGYNYNGRK